MIRKFLPAHIILFLWAGLLCCSSSQAVSGLVVLDSLAIQKDYAPVTERRFDADLEKKYTGRDFHYDTVEGASSNLLRRMVNAFFGWLDSAFGIRLSPQVYKTLEIIIYILLITGAVYLIVKLLFGKEVSVFRPQQKAAAAVLATEEKIERIDFDARIAKAVTDRNYRLAVRFLFLKMLSQLSGKTLIDWHYEKTNTDYYNEIKNEELRGGFRKASYWYDYIWYGTFDIDADTYDGVKRHFDWMQGRILQLSPRADYSRKAKQTGTGKRT